MALIYIVEDDVNIREIETFSLKNSGYTVMDFECAKDFYHKLSDKVPDLILLDIMLPDEDGLEILRKLRKNPETRKVPIIMVTAKTTEIDKVKAGFRSRRLSDKAIWSHGADLQSESASSQKYEYGRIKDFVLR